MSAIFYSKNLLFTSNLNVKMYATTEEAKQSSSYSNAAFFSHLNLTQTGTTRLRSMRLSFDFLTETFRALDVVVILLLEQPVIVSEI